MLVIAVVIEDWRKNKRYDLARSDFLISKKGQATKGSRWIPRHTEAKKDAVTSDILWGAGSRH